MSTKGNRVLIAMDCSEQSKLALDFYLDSLHRRNDIVFVVYCPEVRIDSSSAGFPGTSLSYDDVDKQARQLESRWSEYEEKYKRLLHSHKVNCTFEVVPTTSPGEAVVKRSRELAVELIVVGCRGEGPLGRAMHGSVSSYVVHHSHVPVAVFRHFAQHP